VSDFVHQIVSFPERQKTPRVIERNVAVVGTRCRVERDHLARAVAACRSEIHFSMSDSRQPTLFGPSLTGAGNLPARYQRQMVVPETPTRLSTTGCLMIVVGAGALSDVMA
jgi:hypothetical protein